MIKSVYIIGHKGWIGSMYLNLFQDKGIKCYYSDYRGESDEIKKDIIDKKVSHVLCCMGRTHGIRNGVKYTTIDYLQSHDVLNQNVNDNLFVPLSLSLFCDKHNIHFTYIGTGCIYRYDNKHLIDGMGFTEEDTPNFFGSNYSVIKGHTNELIKYTKALTLRIRMPITPCLSTRNFITKITTYDKICSIKNSMSVLPELLPLSIVMMENQNTGIYNFTNPGSITHNEIMSMYRDIVEPSFTWKNFSIEEQDKILSSKRSNNLLNTNKLTSTYKVDSIDIAIRKVLINMKKLKK